MEVIAVLIITALAATAFIRRSQKRRVVRARLREAFFEQLRSIGEFISRNFSVQACPQCHKTRMKLIEASPSLRSLQYACLNCGKKSYVRAASEEVSELNTRISALEQLMSSLNRISKPRQRIRDFSILFSTPVTPISFQQSAGQAIVRQ